MPFLTCILTVLLRRKSCIFFEYLGKIALILKTDAQHHLHDGQAGAAQVLFAFLHPQAIDILGEGEARLRAEEETKIVFAQVHGAGHFTQRELLPIMGGHVGLGLTHRAGGA